VVVFKTGLKLSNYSQSETAVTVFKTALQVFIYNRFKIETAVMVLKIVLRPSIYNQFKIGNWGDGFENRFKTI
jgi:hypothetical protein